MIDISESGRYYPAESSRGFEDMSDYYFNTATGAEYKLADLFLKGSGYKKAMEKIMRQKIEADGEDAYDDPNPDLDGISGFKLTGDGLQVYYAPYLEDVVTFDFTFSQLESYINKDGEFWKDIEG